MLIKLTCYHLLNYPHEPFIINFTFEKKKRQITNIRSSSPLLKKGLISLLFFCDHINNEINGIMSVK
ncbi:hypothetical protein BpHYR1_022565 [Brachionus plicatilis]|uniref:Uncharacterized protein n=1 Tax=Brachionus plicatilis TaxID=10195 RepID=A0A3M7QFV7_BRAPC|nr:hypothetical protein BpHYR1_022565 [Brachionus plicatilis]